MMVKKPTKKKSIPIVMKFRKIGITKKSITILRVIGKTNLRRNVKSRKSLSNVL